MHLEQVKRTVSGMVVMAINVAPIGQNSVKLLTSVMEVNARFAIGRIDQGNANLEYITLDLTGYLMVIILRLMIF